MARRWSSNAQSLCGCVSFPLAPSHVFRLLTNGGLLRGYADRAASTAAAKWASGFCCHDMSRRRNESIRPGLGSLDSEALPNKAFFLVLSVAVPAVGGGRIVADPLSRHQSPCVWSLTRTGI